MKILPFLSLLTLIIIAGCGSSGSSGKDASATITIASGGGFTGEYKGFTLTRTGHVTRWSALPEKAPDVVDLFKTTPDSAAFFFRYLDEIAFASKEFSTPGNMTTYIETNTDGTKHTVKWGNESVAAPCEFSNFYVMLTGFIDRHKR